MSVTWDSNDPPRRVVPGMGGYVLAVCRALPLALLVFGSLIILLLIRLVERPLFGLHRPVTPFLTQFVCRNAFRLLGIRYETSGRRMHHPGGVVANHSSWLDIYALNAADRLYFVSKSEVAKWPGIGWLARATGTVFIDRDRKQARQQADLFSARLGAGHKLLFFPEGTSTDGRRVLPFRSTLFAAFFDPALSAQLYVQPVTVAYYAPVGQDTRYYGWWGGMDFGSHLIQLLATRPQGRVEVIYHAPLRVADYPDRKALAAACEVIIRDSHAGRIATGT
ncbi:MAG: lysophospholipid acyltransferase family protein [Paracoccaceae bacterium]